MPHLSIVADEWPQMQPLTTFLTQAGYDVHPFEEENMPSDRSTYDAAFMFLHKVIDPRVEQALIGYTENGGRLVILHHGLASAKLQNPDWLRLTGMHIEPKDAPEDAWRVIPDITHTLVNLNPNHYIASNRVAYPTTCEYRSSDRPGLLRTYPAVPFHHTEFFMNQQFRDGREKTVLFGSHCVDPDTGEVVMQDRGGWLKPAKKGWVFYFQPGHLPSDFENETYRQILLNCLTWNGT